MNLKLASKITFLSIVVFALGAIFSCGSVTPLSDGGTAGTTGGGKGGAAGSGVAGTTGTAGNGSAGTGGDGGPITCHVDLNDCPQGSTCACGGPGPAPGICTCHKDCSDASECPSTEPMCGCPSTSGGPRFCVNACFCSCQ